MKNKTSIIANKDEIIRSCMENGMNEGFEKPDVLLNLEMVI